MNEPPKKLAIDGRYADNRDELVTFAGLAMQALIASGEATDPVYRSVLAKEAFSTAEAMIKELARRDGKACFCK